MLEMYNQIDSDPVAVAALMTEQRQRFALAIVIEAVGSTSARTGAKAVFDVEGSVLAGWVGGGCAESVVAHAALECIEGETNRIVDVDLDDEVLGAGMPCGGRMRVYVEAFIPKPMIWILGHGRVAECLCRIGALMGFEITVDDPGATAASFPEARCIIDDDSNYSLLAPAPRDFVVVATQHRGDHQSLRRVLATNVGYIGLIASRKRARLVLEYLRGAGIDESAIDRIRTPCGLDLRARTAEEIALSVISEIVLLRRARSSNAMEEIEPVVSLPAWQSPPYRPVALSSVKSSNAANNA
jgi:xanthine dehydrogenase accessory factor